MTGEQTAPPPAVRFQVPAGFHEVPLGIDADDEVLYEQLRLFARDYWGEQEDLEPLRGLTEAMYAANAEQLVAGGTVYNALGIFPMGGSPDGGSGPPERISRATLTISVREVDNPDPHLTAAGIAETLDKAMGTGEPTEVQPIVLPAGPAVVRVAGARAMWDLPEGEHERFFVHVEVWMPFPEDDRLLLLSLSTPDTQDFYHYQAVLADIADTIAFGEPDVAESGPTAAGPTVSPFTSY
ncbi:MULTISPECIES: hypothetical protein [unclassified Streptomyces]|uniref:hypothetical protein n=1 Tax=unclassified Streptomyces TaxID=2593676 RepID=UPI0033220972